MGYLVRLAPEFQAWLVDLRASDPPSARLAGAAITALLTEGAGLGPPLAPAAPSPAPDVDEALDGTYQHLLEQMMFLRRGVAEVATARKRVELQLSQLAAADPDGQLAGMRSRYEDLGQEQKRLETAAQQFQGWVETFRSRKESLKAWYTAAQAQRTVNEVFAEFGGDGAESTAPFPHADEVLDAARAMAEEFMGIARDLERDLRRRQPGRADPDVTGGAGAGPEQDGASPAQHKLPELLELRCGWPGDRSPRILFATEPAGTAGPASGNDADEAAASPPARRHDVAILLASGAPHAGLHGGADPLVPVALARYQAEQDRLSAGGGPAAGHGARRGDYRLDSFLDQFFPAEATDVQAAAAALVAAARTHQLSEVRRRAGLTQAQVAAELGVRQERVSAIERGDPDAAEVRTLAAYVAALGGHLEVVADFGADRVLLA